MKLTDRTVNDFLAELGSAAPAPGGGSAAALAGAAAAALCTMVGQLTLGKEACRPAWPAVERALVDCRKLEEGFRRLVDEDAAAYQSVVLARGMPRATEGEKAARTAAVQATLLRAALVPLETLENLRACVLLAEMLVRHGSPGCITDAGTAGALCRAGALAAAYNVRINLPSLRDAASRGAVEVRTRAALADAEAAAERIARILDAHLLERSSS
jgi:methenyltetrahydrofolate cyclohydrolase